MDVPGKYGCGYNRISSGVSDQLARLKGHFSWSCIVLPSCRHIYIYNVYCSVRPIVGSMVEKRVSSEVTSTIVTGLKAYTNYYIVVYACIRQLCGNTSNQVIVRTQEARKLIMLTACTYNSMSALFCGISPTSVDYVYTCNSWCLVATSLPFYLIGFA